MSAIPSMALNEMHRAEKRYEVGRVFGKQEAKQRQLRSILNKLTPQNFEPLFEQVLHVTLFDAAAVPDFVLQIVGRAIGESIYCKMYAELCYLVNGKLPVYFSSDNKMITVKRLVLNECQEIFERGFMVVEEGTIKSCEDERKDDKIKTHIHMLGTIQFIGELFKKKMILLKVIHHIIQVLLEGYQNPDEKNIEALCLLMTTAGEMLDDQSEGLMDTYFSRMLELSANQKVSSRVRFMVMNAIDLRNNDWRERRKIERPTKICDVHLAGKQHTQYRPYGFTVISQTQLDYGSPDPCVQDVFEEGLLIRRYEHIGRMLFRSIPNNLRSSHAKILDPDNPAGDPAVHLLETGSIQASVSSETRQKVRGKTTDPPCENPVSAALSGPKDKPALEPARAKITSSKKKKRREILHKADLPGSSDLYNAYKGPEEKLETARTLESTNSSLSVDMQDASLNDLNQEAVVNEDDGPGKSEVDDWEDAADISTPKLRASEISNHVDGARKQHDKYGNEISGKKYSRDFLLTFSEQCTQLPVGFEIGSDIVNAVMSGRSMDRSSGGPRADRRAVGIVDDDRWAKSPGPFGAGQDVRLDIGHGAAVMNLRPGQGITHGVLRNPRGQPSGQYVGGILTGPLQPMPLPGGVRNGADADRWQRTSNFQRAVPQAPTQVMHKAVKKYEVGIVSDEEEAKQRQLKGILNKLTPQNFEKLFAQVKEVNIDNTVTLKGIIAQIFDKALTEPTFCEMYASFCHCLAADLPDFIEDNEKVTFKRLLLTKCQEEFERGEREQAEADKAAEEGEIEQSEGEREEKRIKARRRMLGNIRLIGELYKKKMLTERIMHECIKKLLGQYQNPDEEDIEALCKLMSTIGEMIDHPKAKEHMDAYFDMMLKLSTNQKLSSRLRFMLKDAIDLRKNKWQQRRKVEGPKKIEEVHRDVAFERQAQASRSARGPVITSSPRKGAPADYGPRGASGLSAASQQMGGSRGFPSQSRAYGIQDVRFEGRHIHESRTLSVPLPPRPTDDDSITLGPQGGLARGMSIRGQPLVSNAPPLAETPNVGENRRTTLGPNGYHSTQYNSREEVAFRNLPDRTVGTSYDQPTRQDHNTYSGSRDSMTADHSSEPPTSFAPAGRVQESTISSQTVTSEAKPLSEDDLKDKSISAIREYYSAKDEEEVTWCINELNSPGFYPTMISLWVTDSFERKNMERECLAKLLVNLCKSRERLLGQSHLIQGFQFVLSTLEDAVNDAPKAAEFLGQLFAKVILENVVSFADIGRLIQEGGEEPGQLIEIGLASEVLGSTLEFIKLEKGDAVLNEIRASSNLRLEDFRPPHPMKAKKLDVFLQM